MEKYRIAMVSDWYYPKVGGIEYSINALARALGTRGHEVHIITRKYHGVAECESLNGVYVRRVKGKPLCGRFLNPTAYRELYDMLKEGGYDIVHAHGMDSPLSMVSPLACRRLGIPVVVTHHSLVGRTPLRPIFLFIGGLLLKNVDAVIAVSSAVKRECRLMTRARVYVIPNGVEVDLCDSREPPFNRDGKTVIATVARMTSHKKVEDMPDIAAMLLKKRKNLLFLMVGDGPLRERVEDKVRKLNISANFHFTGEIARRRVLNLLEHSDIFVLPSEGEAFGIAVLEAISKGVVVVARNDCGVSDIITHKKTGLLAEHKYEIASYVEELIEHPELRKRFSRAALRELCKYNWDDIAGKVEKVYSGVINAKSFDHS